VVRQFRARVRSFKPGEHSIKGKVSQLYPRLELPVVLIKKSAIILVPKQAAWIRFSVFLKAID
jgi:hypothetical protein